MLMLKDVSKHSSFIAHDYGKSEAAVCHFLRGYNAGLAEVLKEKYIEACETRCAAKGDDCCEFKHSCNAGMV